MIRFTNSSVISTFDLSREPDNIVPKPSAPASPTIAVPETDVSTLEVTVKASPTATVIDTYTLVSDTA